MRDQVGEQISGNPISLMVDSGEKVCEKKAALGYCYGGKREDKWVGTGTLSGECIKPLV